MNQKLQEHIVNMLMYSREVVWCVHADTYDIVYVNNACVGIWGYTPEEMMADKNIFFSSIHPEDVDTCYNGFKLALEKGKSHNEFRVLSKDGGLRVIKGEAIFLKGTDGFPDTFTGIAQDVTAQHTLMDKLTASERKFHTMADDAPVLVWTSSFEHGVEYTNKEWIGFTGLDSEKLSGSNWTGLLHPDEYDKITGIRETLYTEKRPFEIECKFKRKDSEYRTLLLKGAPTIDSNGNCTGFVGTGTDITDIKNYSEHIQRSNIRLQEALLESNRLLRIVNKTSNIIVLTDPEGKITWANEAFTKTTGYTLEEALGKKPGNLVQGPETDPATVALLRNAIENGETVKAEILNYSKDGRKYWLDIRIEPIYSGGILSGFMAIEMDITQRKLDEKVLAETNKRIRKFSFITSHELRHEFSKIMLLINAGKLENTSAEDMGFYYKELENSANNMNAIIQNMNENLDMEGKQNLVQQDITIGNTEEICLIDDDMLINTIHKRIITRILPDVQIKVFENITSALEYIKIQPSLRRLIFLDLNFPDSTGWDFLDQYTEMELSSPVIIVSSSINNNDREKSKKYPQVKDFLAKPITLELLQKLFKIPTNADGSN